MECKVHLCLSSGEISRARTVGEVTVGRQDDTNSWECDIEVSSVTKAVRFLKTIYDLQGYTDEELEESYIDSIK